MAPEHPKIILDNLEIYIYIYIYAQLNLPHLLSQIFSCKGCSKSSNPHLERRTIAEHFYCGNIQHFL